MTPSRPGQGSRGIALLDAVIALAILGVAAAALLGAVTQASRAARHAEATIEATSLAARLIDTARTVPPSRLEPIAEGRAGDFRWTRTVMPDGTVDLTSLSTPTRLMRIEITVAWDEGGRASHVTLSALKAELLTGGGGDGP